MKTSIKTIAASPALTIFWPSPWRYFTFRILFMFAAYQTGFTIFGTFLKMTYGITYPRDAWLVSSAAFILVFSLCLIFSNLRFRDDYSIRIEDGFLEGPSGVLNRRERFPFTRLDCSRCQRLAWYNWLFQYRYLWSLDGERLVLFIHAFDARQLDLLYAKLGLKSYNSGNDQYAS